jgi:hypothetical protein
MFRGSSKEIAAEAYVLRRKQAAVKANRANQPFGVNSEPQQNCIAADAQAGSNQS